MGGSLDDIIGAQNTGGLACEVVPAVKALDSIDDRLAFVTDHNELGDTVCELVALRNRLDATLTRVIGSARNNGVPQVNGQRTVGQYVASRTSASPITVNSCDRLDRWLRDYPHFADAFGTAMFAEHLHYLRKLDDTLDKHERLIADQQMFVDIAATCTFKDFTIACDYWLVRIDPDGKEPIDQLEKNRLSLRAGVGGRGAIKGECDAVTRQMLATALDHESDKIRTADKQQGIERTTAQRRMAALVSLVTRGFARNDGSFPAPLINIVMSLEVAEWAQQSLAGPPDTRSLCFDNDRVVPVNAQAIDGRCELIDGTPIHPFMAALAMRGGIAYFDPADTGSDEAAPGHHLPFVNLRRYVMSADSRALDVSVNSRYFPQWMRTTSLVESRGQCTTAGCDSPHAWIQIDHIDPVANGGQTRPDNAQPQCQPDNMSKGAQVGIPAWRDRTPPRRHQSFATRQQRSSNDDDPDHQFQ